MRFFKILFIIFFVCFSFVAPYKAYFSHKPLLINQSLTIEDGSTINMVISEIYMSGSNFIVHFQGVHRGKPQGRDEETSPKSKKKSIQQTL